MSTLEYFAHSYQFKQLYLCFQKSLFKAFKILLLFYIIYVVSVCLDLLTCLPLSMPMFSLCISGLPSRIISFLKDVIQIFLQGRSPGFKISGFVSLEMSLFNLHFVDVFLMGIQFCVDGFILPELKMVSIVIANEMSPAVTIIASLKTMSLLLLLRSLSCHCYLQFYQDRFRMDFFTFVLLECLGQCLLLILETSHSLISFIYLVH